MNGLICNAHLVLTSLYFFGKKENGMWGKDILFDIMDDPTDVVAVFEEFVDEENHNWDIYFLIKVSIMCEIFERIFWNENEEEMNVPPLGVLQLLYILLAIDSLCGASMPMA